MTLGEMVAQYRAQQAAPQAAPNRQLPQVQTQQMPAGLAQMVNYSPLIRNRYDLMRGSMF